MGVTLATISFGQLVSHHKSFNETEYNEENGKVTHWVSHLSDRKLRDAAHKEYKPRIISRTYFAKEMEVFYESLPVIEEWMTAAWI